MDAFSKDNFEIAYTQFTELSASFPKDPLYKYYCGVCLVRLNREPAKAASLLQEAIQGSAAIRSVPADGLFYLGRAWQMAGNFRDAIKYYNLYTEQVGRKASREAGVPQYLQQCNERKGQISTFEVKKPEHAEEDNIIKLPTQTDQKIVQPETRLADTLTGHKELLPVSYDSLLSQALDYQFRSDSLSGLATQVRKSGEMAGDAERAELKSRAQTLEQLSAYNQKMADMKIADAQKFITKPELIESDTVTEIQTTDQKAVKPDSIKNPEIKSTPVIQKDTVIVQKATQPERNVTIPADKTVQNSPGIFSVFEVVGRPVYSANEKVKVNPEVPPGLIYRIQVAVFRNPVAPSYFKGLTPVFGFRGEGTEISTYYAGMFRKHADAAKALTRVRGLGFKDAFIVALIDKKIVSNERAAILEKDWGSKSLSSAKQKTDDMPHDTVPPTLVFRVEVLKSVKPAESDLLENIKKLAGARGLDIIVNEIKQNIYLIGTFLTYESAVEYSDLLVRNGLREAKVVAYLGKREIPVETARQLFEKY